MRNLLTLLIFGTLLVPLGCGSMGPLDKVIVPEPGPTGLDEQQFDDVPTIRGFRLDTRRSFSYRASRIRMGRFVYLGTRLSPGRALLHYETEMVRPLYGWAMTESVEGEGRAEFRKGPDHAIVHVDEKGDFTRVTIDVNYREDTDRTQP